MSTPDLPKITLHWLDRSRSQRIVWLLEELELPYEVKIYHRDKATNFAPPELEKVHPLGKSPVVTVQTSDDGAPPVVLAESGFITQYLVEHASPSGRKKLMPDKWKPGREATLGGETDAWMRYQYYMHYVEGSLMSLLVLSLFIGGLRSPAVPFFIRPVTGLVANRIFASFIFPNARRNLAMLEGHLAESESEGGGYLCGGELSAADILVSFPLIAAKDKLDGFGAWQGGGGWRSEFPGVAAYVERLEGEEGYKRSVEKIKELDGDFKAI